MRIPGGLLNGLPEGDQEAIRSVVGKSSTFLGYDPGGRAELEFTDDEGVILDFCGSAGRTINQVI
jgi:hypothetical protein